MFLDENLELIWQKVQSGERISREEGISLFHSNDLIGLGKIANFMKEKKTQHFVTYVINRQINPTNICIHSCKICDFSSKKGEDRAYAMELDEIISKCTPDLQEVHITSALNPDWPFENYLNIVRTIHNCFPKIQIKAYTAVEIDFFAEKEKCSVDQILKRLKDAGVISLPGGGAEIFSKRVRNILFPGKISAERWLEIHRIAHKLGINSNATMLYGHIETVEEKVDHLIQLRTLQDETGGFLSFVPLRYQTGKTRVVRNQTSAVEDLKTIAVSRILLDNFEHIKAYWVNLGEEIASVALNFGADDLDGTIGEEKIMHEADARGPVQLTSEKLERLIRSASRIPMERDALHRPLNKNEEIVIGN